MNPAISEFLDAAQLPALCGFIAAIFRVFCSPPSERDVAIPLSRKAGVIFASVMLAGFAGYLAHQYQSTRALSFAWGFVTSFFSQDIAMVLARKGAPLISAAADRIIDDKFPEPKTKPVKSNERRRR